MLGCRSRRPDARPIVGQRVRTAGQTRPIASGRKALIRGGKGTTGSTGSAGPPWLLQLTGKLEHLMPHSGFMNRQKKKQRKDKGMNPGRQGKGQYSSRHQLDTILAHHVQPWQLYGHNSAIPTDRTATVDNHNQFRLRISFPFTLPHDSRLLRTLLGSSF